MHALWIAAVVIIVALWGCTGVPTNAAQYNGRGGDHAGAVSTGGAVHGRGATSGGMGHGSIGGRGASGNGAGAASGGMGRR